MAINSLARTAVFCITTISLPFLLCAQQTSATDDYNAVAAATKLDREGARPFHLKMETQVYDLNGKPSETGTIEEWWLAPDQFRIEINSGDIHEIILTGELDQVVPGVHRSAFLLRQLLTYTVSPLTPMNTNEEASEVTREINGHSLSCFSLSPISKTELARRTTYCREPGGNNIRLIVSPDSTAVRNSVGSFGPTNIALDVNLSYMGHPAVSGKVVALQVFDPAAPGSPVIKVSKVYNSDPHIPSPAVVAGHFRSSPTLIYPIYAKHEHISGVVLLACRVTRDGKVDSADVIASSNTIFDDAAKTNVEQWFFTPFTYKDHPVPTQILVQVRFLDR